MIITVCADKGSPGVSTLATALALVWPGEKVLLEADPSGGDAALRMRTSDGALLPRHPTVRALSVDARSGIFPLPLLSYAHRTSLGIPVIPASDMRSADFALIAAQWPAVAASAYRWPGAVIADLGRLQEDTASGPIAAASTIVLLIGRATTGGMYHLRERAGALTARLGQGLHGRSPLAVALICRPSEHAARLRDLQALLAADAATAAVPVAGWIADDPRGAAELQAGALTRHLMRCDLIRTASALAAELQARAPADQDMPQDAPSMPTADPAGASTGNGRVRPWRT